ncbi:MAG TPA: helix-turn-helix transcriptional regulator [Solirubrobacterales bacterium]|nr:helix-turn-helix transcriptional regulator [Solirubrobacterales bacterium]
MSVAKQFGANLARIRKRADQSQEETAVRASVHRTEISHLERGLRVARVDTVAKLAAALEVDPGDFFDGIVWQQGDVRYGQFKPDDPATL